MTLTAKPQYSKWLFAIFIVILTFSMMCIFMYDPLFSSDEEEIFNKGQAITYGEILYSDIGSQHMPLMYYFAAVFALVGADTVIKFRLCFYALMAVLWGLIALRYSERFGKKIIALVPLLYIPALSLIGMGSSILSEQMQTFGMVILAFELLQFDTEKTITIGSCLMISLAIFLSFGSAFVSVFAIFAVGVTVLALEIAACVKAKRGFFKSIGYLINRYWKLVLIVAAPFAVMLGYFAAVGALDDFYGWAYVINREIYPKYIAGYGSSIIGSLFGGITHLVSPISEMAFSQGSFAKIILLTLAIIGLCRIHQKKHTLLLCGGLVFLLIAAATRGCFSFHGLPAVGLLAVLGAFALRPLIGRLCVKTNTAYLKRGTAAVMALVVITPYLTDVSSTLQHEPALIASGEVTHHSQAVDTLTEDGERVGFSLLNYEILISSHTIPATSNGGSCPWLWEWAKDDVMDELNTDPPRVFLHNRDLATWNYKITDYAPELIEFLDANYRSLADYGYDSLYIHNDYYEEALSKLDLT